MNPDKDQVFIYNEAELSLIKNTFSENDPLIYAIRKVLLQFELNDGDKALLKLVNPEVLHVLKKRILPTISNEFPLGQLPSLMVTLTNDLKVKEVDQMALQFEAKKIEIEYLEQQFKVLAGEDTEETIKLAELGNLRGTEDEQFVNMTAYLFLLGYIDTTLIMIKTIAGKKEETLSQLNERMKRDSNK
jgi:hypothetical protein